MGMTAAAYLDQLQALLPQGAAWPREPDATLTRLLAALADEYARVDGRAGQLIEEADPRTTYELLADWERVAGLPDACAPFDSTTAQRRAALHARLTTLGGQSAAYYIEVAAALGYQADRWSPFAWEFVGTTDGWSTNRATLTVGAESIAFTATSNDPILRRTNLAVDGSRYRYVVARLRRLAGSHWEGMCYYMTSGHGESGSYRQIISQPPGLDIGFVTAVWDMHNLFAGGDDWRTNTITSVRLDLSELNGSAYEIDWIAISEYPDPHHGVSITEFHPHSVADDVAYPLYGQPWAFAWQVDAALATVGELTVSDSVADPIAWWGNSALECVLSRLKPAHTHVLFAYS